MAEQQVQLTDLDPEQLQQVKKQLDEVSVRRGVGQPPQCSILQPSSRKVEARARWLVVWGGRPIATMKAVGWPWPCMRPACSYYCCSTSQLTPMFKLS